MQLTKLISTKDGKEYYGIIYRDQNKDWQFRNWTEKYGWQDSFLTYFKPDTNKHTDSSEQLMMDDVMDV